VIGDDRQRGRRRAAECGAAGGNAEGQRDRFRVLDEGVVDDGHGERFARLADAEGGRAAGGGVVGARGGGTVAGGVGGGGGEGGGRGRLRPAVRVTVMVAVPWFSLTL